MDGVEEGEGKPKLLKAKQASDRNLGLHVL